MTPEFYLKGTFKMADNNNNIEVNPFDALLNKHRQATGAEAEKTNTTSAEVMPHHQDADIDVDDTPVVNTVASEPKPLELPKDIPAVNEDDDIYGTNDLEKEIREEDARRAEERERKLAERKAEEEANKAAMPAQSLDPEYQKKAVTFQVDKIAMINRMCQMVLKKYKITTGEIPESYPPEDTHDKLTRLQCMGEMTEYYENHGAVIDETFEKLLLDNWQMPDGQYACEWIHNGDTPSDDSSNEETNQARRVTEDVDVTPTINIFAPDDASSIVVNINEDMLADLSEEKKVNVKIKRVSEKELISAPIIENSDKPGIIKPYAPATGDIALTLPMSGYRCTVSALNWFEALNLEDVAGKNSADRAIDQWSTIYKHIKNPSIGNFKSFEDFLKKTNYLDQEYFMWGLLTATTGDHEEFMNKCSNPKCEKGFLIKYDPHTVAHINKEHLDDDYIKTHEVSPGEEAMKHFNKVQSKRMRYELPESKVIIDIGSPSVYDFINNRLGVLDKLGEQMVREAQIAGDENYRSPRIQLQMTFNLYINSVLIPVTENGVKKYYKYDKWNDILEALDSLSWGDSGIMMKLMQTVAEKLASPIDMYIENITCPHCKKHFDKMFIGNIQNQLLFRASRRLENTEISLIETV